MSPYQIVLAEDNVCFRKSLKDLLEGNPEMRVVGEAGDGLELLNLLSLNGFAADMVILDISMPRMSGIEALREIKRFHPGLKVLILSMHTGREYVELALREGAIGYVLKEDADRELFHAIDAAGKGEVYVSPLLSEDVSLK